MLISNIRYSAESVLQNLFSTVGGLISTDAYLISNIVDQESVSLLMNNNCTHPLQWRTTSFSNIHVFVRRVQRYAQVWLIYMTQRTISIYIYMYGIYMYMYMAYIYIYMDIYTCVSARLPKKLFSEEVVLHYNRCRHTFLMDIKDVCMQVSNACMHAGIKCMYACRYQMHVCRYEMMYTKDVCIQMSNDIYVCMQISNETYICMQISNASVRTENMYQICTFVSARVPKKLFCTVIAACCLNGVCATYTHIQTHTDVHKYMYIYVHKYVYMHTCTYVYIRVKFIHEYMGHDEVVQHYNCCLLLKRRVHIHTYICV